MNDKPLHEALIKLAQDNPQLRGDLLPILREAGAGYQMPGRLLNVPVSFKAGLFINHKMAKQTSPAQDHYSLTRVGVEAPAILSFLGVTTKFKITYYTVLIDGPHNTKTFDNSSVHWTSTTLPKDLERVCGAVLYAKGLAPNSNVFW